jgi:EAL domain-containing protein (putative c-di-GMP-specific phosphodiesterase class I)
LREVGDRLEGCLRAVDTAARLGGDEFAVLLEDGGGEVHAVEVADRVLKGLVEPFSLDGREIVLRASIGIAVSNAGGGEAEDGDELLRNAEAAMYIAKESGKGRHQIFESAMHESVFKRLELRAALQNALDNGEFVVHYQPVIELSTGAIVGAEALVRWDHPERGLVPPMDFIPLAEESGLIVPIGAWVLAEACRSAADLQARFPSDPPFHMAVNLSARQLTRSEIVTEVGYVLAETGLDPGSLVLEITESMVMRDIDLSIERMTKLKELGIQLAIDDFGTGYSSLNYVRRFPVDVLKVDKSFIDEIAESEESRALTAAVVELARILGLRTVAEGIEHADQLERLQQMGCEFGQGFLFAKPLPMAELQAMLTERAGMKIEADALSNG